MPVGLAGFNRKKIALRPLLATVHFYPFIQIQ